MRTGLSRCCSLAVAAAAVSRSAALPASSPARGMMTSTHKIRQENGGYTLVLDPRKGAADSLVVVSHGLGDTAHGEEFGERGEGVAAAHCCLAKRPATLKSLP
jgi:hypothetical protein